VSTPFASGTGTSVDSGEGDSYRVSVEFPPSVFALLVAMAADKKLSLDEMVVHVCKKGLDALG
jgi:hypothetical protein